ncbi:hemin-degrading factor [Roseicella frigidaeris]|uniref:Hemin-degrading factor n=1 Tax=Roseicella frigidaeris TaxID=2230885 RepID=A0A327MDJ9_9PROT|nr:ChuX/HutX family heme-like substrate-binding protein [Roseicella frigidaeris]RAI60729.1 hemin-degrading factor [Roseicella frigidaeris]
MTALAERYAALAAEGRPPRARDAARRLGTTEAALVACGATGPVVSLRPDWPALIGALPRLGRVMALTRNEHAVHERHGTYREVSSGPGHILVLGPEIDLRLFPGRWAHGFALAGERPSIQIFDRDGEAAHKVFAVPGETDMAAWGRLVAAFTASGLAPPLLQAPPAPPPATETLVDAVALRADWLALRDTHDFVRLLRAHRATRRQALALAGEDLALRLEPGAAVAALQRAAERAVPIMVFVSNRSAIQIHTGLVRRLLPSPGGWFNVLDPAFNLHLRESAIAAAWRVVKPTEDGAVTSIELFDKEGGLILQLFGARKPGLPEQAAWRELAAELADGAARETAA